MTYSFDYDLSELTVEQLLDLAYSSHHQSSQALAIATALIYCHRNTHPWMNEQTFGGYTATYLDSDYNRLPYIEIKYLHNDQTVVHRI